MTLRTLILVLFAVTPTGYLVAQSVPDFLPQVVSRACQASKLPPIINVPIPWRARRADSAAYPLSQRLQVPRVSLPGGLALDGLDAGGNLYFASTLIYDYPYSAIGYQYVSDYYWAGEAFTTYFAPLDGPTGTTRFWVKAGAKVFIKNALGKWGKAIPYESEWMSNPAQSEIFNYTRSGITGLAADSIRSLLFRARAGTGEWPNFFIYLGDPTKSVRYFAPSADLLCPFGPSPNYAGIGVGMRVRGEHWYRDPTLASDLPPVNLGFTRVQDDCNLNNWGFYGETRTNQFSD